MIAASGIYREQDRNNLDPFRYSIAQDLFFS
jgi:hypothetical protein